MIYGPYSSGWRDEEDEREARRARRGAMVGAAVLLASAALVLKALGVF